MTSRKSHGCDLSWGSFPTVWSPPGLKIPRHSQQGPWCCTRPPEPLNPFDLGRFLCQTGSQQCNYQPTLNCNVFCFFFSGCLWPRRSVLGHSCNAAGMVIKGALGAFILRGNLAVQEFLSTLHDRQLSDTAELPFFTGINLEIHFLAHFSCLSLKHVSSATCCSGWVCNHTNRIIIT